ncbi:plasmid transfer protein TraA [Streptomyces sp.]|uniref:plasmid transfer protein TraA n=1 Tax=Streptomyces sp. TaxID=1931 RepID=UPI002F3FC1FB
MTAEPDFDLRPGGAARPGPVPPRPAQPPRTAPGPQPGSAQQRHQQRGKTINKTRNLGGINPSINPSLSINITKGGGNGAGQGTGPAGAGAGGAGNAGTPGSGFMSNEDIHKFSEHIRKEGRKRAGERAMDAEQLEQVLRHIPDSTGSMAGARMRARRVSRHLKRIAKAEQLIAKEAAALYAQFEREYEAELRKVGRGRAQQPSRTAFGWR